MLHAVELPASLSPPPTKPVLLECYTDPLCCRSAAFEQHWRRLRAEFGCRLDWRNRLGGLSAASYTAGLAVKCANQQGSSASELYLLAVREAVLPPGRGVARPEVLAAVAEELAAQMPAVFTVTSFHQAMAANAGAQALNEDWQLARYHHLSCFPAITMQRGTEPSQLVVVGNRPYEALLSALAHLAPDLFYVASLVDGGAG